MAVFVSVFSWRFHLYKNIFKSKAKLATARATAIKQFNTLKSDHERLKKLYAKVRNLHRTLTNAPQTLAMSK
jgi:hypothetical protein